MRCSRHPGLGPKPTRSRRTAGEARPRASAILVTIPKPVGRPPDVWEDPQPTRPQGAASEPQATATRLQSGQRGTDGGHGAGRAWGRPEFPSGSRGSPGASRCLPQATAHPLCDRRATDAPSATAEAAASLLAWPLTAGEAGGGRASLASPSRGTHTRRPEPEAPGQRHEPRDSLCGRRIPKPASW